MQPSPQAIAFVVAQNPDWTKDDATLLAALGAASVANPAARAQVPKSVYPSVILPMLGADSLKAVNASAFAPSLFAAMNNGLNSEVVNWAGFFAAIGSIQQAEAQAIVAQATGTEPDPAWPSEVSPFRAAGGAGPPARRRRRHRRTNRRRALSHG